VGEDRPQTSRQRVTVAQAAEILGVTVEAVRGRIKRGTLDHERTDKSVFVLLETDQPYDRPRPDIDQTADRLQSDSSALISAKDETIATLRDQLEAERQAHAEARRLLMAALERIPAIEAPSDDRESSETVDDQQGGDQPHSDAPGAQEGVQRPWWRRLLGG
jgi:chromosome segregation ATPase